MSRIALLMAGGRGTRMGGPLAKPLTSVLGMPLIERNLHSLLAVGFDHIVIAASTERPAVAAWARSRGLALAQAAGAKLEVTIETSPRGTIGAASTLRKADRVLVQCADNLIGLDLSLLDEAHVDAQAHMTIATHEEPFRIPFGRLSIANNVIQRYDEKPTIGVPISSGAYVLGPTALDIIPTQGRFDTPQLVDELLARGARVHAYEHSSPWIDVNDPSAVLAATAMVAQQADLMECWRKSAQVTAVVGALLVDDAGQYLLEWRGKGAKSHAGWWDTPGGKIEANETPADAIHRELEEELSTHPRDLSPLCVFDDLDTTSGRWFRHHVFVGHIHERPRAMEGQRLAWHTAAPDALMAQPALRAIAYFEEVFHASV